MAPFLDKVAEYIHDQYGEQAGELCIVLPHIRAGLFLKQYLARHFKKTIWSPQITSIQDFVIKETGLEIIDQVERIFEFYQVHQELAGSNCEEIDRFMDWGRVVLSDFNEIDMYLADASDLFAYLTEAKAITTWNPDLSPLTDSQKQFLDFYKSLVHYYSLFRERLLKKNKAYQGLAYRKLADDIEDKLDGLGYHQIIFAGFNAFSLAEEKIITSLVTSGKAELLWDADEYYLNDRDMEAGKFIRKYVKKWGEENIKWIGNYYKEKKKKITITGVAKNIGQVKFTSQLLADESNPEAQPDDTAIILADEKLLIPLLNSLPKNIKVFNITMGYPLKYTSLFQLLLYILNLHEKSTSGTREVHKPGMYYVKDILDILTHPYLRQWDSQVNHPGTERSSLGRVTEKIRTANKVFYTHQNLEYIFNSLEPGLASFLKLILKKWNSTLQATAELTAVLDHLRDHFILANDKDTNYYKLDIEYVFCFSKLVRQLHLLLSKYDFINSIQTLKRLFIQLSGNEKMPFYGEPLQGVQIMGMLETRSLDFKNIILLSVNENIVPAGRKGVSFIPFDIKLDFGLPTFRDKDAIYAYHFYRMLQRSENINLVYNTEPDEFGSGEKSRFITQLRYELPEYNPMVSIREQLLTVPPETGKSIPPVVINKHAAILAALREKASNGFSPSSLSTYINCKLQFYFSYIARLKKAEEIEENVDAATLGQVIHEVLRALYKPFLGRVLQAGDLKLAGKSIRQETEKAFHEQYEDGDISFGKNFLIFNLAVQYVSRFIDEEIKSLSLEKDGNQLTVNMLEEMMSVSMEAGSGSEKYPVKIRGKVDRIDMCNSTIRIIDYKTGNVENKELDIKDWNDLTADST